MLRKRFWVVLIGAVLICLAVAEVAQAQSILYGAASPPTFNADGAALSSPSSLYTIDSATGKETLVGRIGFNDVGGMDFHPLTGILYAVGRRPANAAVGPGVVVLLTIDSVTGVGTEIVHVPSFCDPPGPLSDPGLRCMAFADLSFGPDGVLYAVVGTTDIGTIDISTGAVTLFPGSSGFPFGFFLAPIDSLAFSPNDSMLCGRAFEANFFCMNPADPSAPFGLLGLSIPITLSIPTAGGGGFLLGSSVEVTAMSALDAQPGTGTLFGVVTQLAFPLPLCSNAPNVQCLFPPVPPCLDVPLPCLVTVVPGLLPGTLPGTGNDIFVANTIGPTVNGLDAIAWSIPAPNTPAGTNVTVQLPPVTLTFANVTQAGNTSATTSTAGPPPPSGFKLGNPPTYFELSTTAVFSGPIQICIDYSGIAFGSTASLKLQHFENGAWVDVTASLDTVNKVICGVTTSLSPFAIFEPEIVDTTPPVVTPPTGITVPATEADGARGNASATLAAFLAGASAVDNADPAPVRLAPQVGGVDVDNNTLLPLGATAVIFRFMDSSGNTGTGMANVTVVLGLPRISGSVVGKGVDASGARSYDVKLTNTGTGNARNLRITQVLLRTLLGSGNVTYNATLSPSLPMMIGSLDVGASVTRRLFLDVPATVTKLAIIESGSVQDVVGTNYTYSTAEVVFP